MNNRQMGTFYEREAMRFLMSKGVRILETNYRCRQGEIDIIGYEGTCLIFFEVKARKTGVAGTGAEAIDRHKQRKICRVADYYRFEHGIGEYEEIRYDCVVVDSGKMSWIKNAFGHVF
jgi:putative endonuclease